MEGGCEEIRNHVWVRAAETAKGMTKSISVPTKLAATLHCNALAILTSIDSN